MLAAPGRLADAAGGTPTLRGALALASDAGAASGALTSGGLDGKLAADAVSAGIATLAGVTGGSCALSHAASRISAIHAASASGGRRRRCGVLAGSTFMRGLASSGALARQAM